MSDADSKNMLLICCARPSPHPPLRFIKLTLHARQMEQGTVKYKQLKLIEDRGGGMRADGWEPPVNLPVLPISSSQGGFGRTESRGYYYFLQVKAVKDISLCEMETGNELQLFWECGTAVQMQRWGGGVQPPHPQKKGCQGTITTEQEK